MTNDDIDTHTPVAPASSKSTRRKSTSQCHLTSLPNVILHFITNVFMTDREAIATARTQHALHRIISAGYRSKEWITYYICIDTNTNLRFIRDTRPVRTPTSQQLPFQPHQRAHRIAEEVAGVSKMVSSSSASSSRGRSTLFVLNTSALQWSVGIRTRIQINTKFANSPNPPLKEEQNDDDDVQTDDSGTDEEDEQKDDTRKKLPRKQKLAQSKPADSAPTYMSPSPFHSVADWNFLPSQIRELTIECRKMDAVRMPSLAGFRYLDSITFAHSTNFNFPFLTNQSLWPSQLRSLEYMNEGKFIGYASEISSDSDSDDFFGRSQEERKARKTAQLERLKPHFAKAAHRIYLPPTLTSFILPQFPKSCEALNRDMRMVEWPPGLTRLCMRCHYHHFIEPNFTLPDSVTELELGEYGRYSLAGWVPPRSLRTLMFGLKSFEDISKIAWQSPSTQDEMDVTDNIAELTPSSGLTHLRMNVRFKENVAPGNSDLQLPSTVTHLEFQEFTTFTGRMHEIVFPHSLRTLIFRHRHAENLVGVTFPSTLSRLEFHNWASPGQPFEPNVFTKYEKLESLHLGCRRIRSSVLSSLRFPPSLRSLTFGAIFNDRVDKLKLNKGLTSLTFGARFNSSLSTMKFPKSLRNLTFNEIEGDFSHPLDLHSTHIKVLKLSYLWNGIDVTTGRLDLGLPESLRVIHFGQRFNQSLAGYEFPPRLRELHLNHTFSQSMAGTILPASLKVLTFGEIDTSFALVDSLTTGLFPPMLIRLSLPHPDAIQSHSHGNADIYDVLIAHLQKRIGEVRLLDLQ